MVTDMFDEKGFGMDWTKSNILHYAFSLKKVAGTFIAFTDTKKHDYNFFPQHISSSQR